MIKINLTDDVCEFYYNQIEKEFTQLLNSLKGEPKLKNLISFLFDKWGHLDEIKLKRLLVGSPHDLEKIISEIGKIPVGGNHRLVKFYKKISQRKVIREILKEINSNVCPYCNRMYTITLEKGRVRPQLDHFYPKTLYPYLSVSLYNLIPCCSICNQKKSQLDPCATPILHPYKEEFGNNVIFEISPTKNCYKYLIGDSEDFEIKLKCLDSKMESKVSNLNQTFAITDIYNEHKEYITDLLKMMVVYNQSQLDEYNQNFSNLFNGRANMDKEIYNIIMPNLPKESWRNKSFGKLTNDIYNQFK